MIHHLTRKISCVLTCFLFSAYFSIFCFSFQPSSFFSFLFFIHFLFPDLTHKFLSASQAWQYSWELKCKPWYKFEILLRILGNTIIQLYYTKQCSINYYCFRNYRSFDILKVAKVSEISLLQGSHVFLIMSV